MEPFTLALAGGSILSQILGGSAQRKQANQALAQQMRMFSDQMRLAKGKRTDAYGNEVFFDDATGEWKTVLTPMQQALIKAQEHEQFVGLTEDAGRNRQARRRQAAIGESSAEDYNRELAGYRYEPRKSEDQILGEITNLLARSRTNQNGANTRQALRRGQPLIRASNEVTGPDPGQQALMARKAALDEFLQRESGRNSRFLPALGFFREGAGAGGGAPISFGNANQSLGATQDSMAKLIASVGQSGASNLLRANEGVTKAIGEQYPDTTDAARLIGALRGYAPRGKAGVAPIASSTSYAKDNRTIDDYWFS